MNRRRYLALVGTGIGSIAGCAGRSPGGSPTTSSGTPTPSGTPDRGRRVSMGETVTSGNTSVTVGTPRVRKAVVARGVHDPTVRARAGQFVVVDVRVDGERPDLLDEVDLRSAVGGEPLTGSDPLPTTNAGEFAFPLPTERHDDAAVRWSANEGPVYWDLSAPVREALASEPDFRVGEFAVPRRDGELVLELTVANEGERDGWFLAEVSMEAFSGKEVIEFPVPAGETHTYRGRAGKTLLYFENNGGGTLTVTYPGNEGMASVERTVEVAGTTTEN